MGLKLTAITHTTAKQFVAEHHRHNVPPYNIRFVVGVEDDTGQLVGVATASQPTARMFNNTDTIEINRTCTNGTRNANSMLYGAMLRAAKALGFKRAITYSLVTESGASLKATGWTLDADQLRAKTWNQPNRHRYDRDLFGTRLPPPEKRRRWVRWL